MKVISLLIVVLVLVGCSNSSDTGTIPDVASPAPLPTVNPSDVEMVASQRNYDIYCAHCHGYSGGGQPTGGGPGTVEWNIELGYDTVPLHNSEGFTWQHPDQLLFEVIKYGIENPLNLYVMSAHEAYLSDDEILGVIDYIKRFWTKDQREYQADLTAQFAENRPDWEQYHLDIYSVDAEAD